MQVGSYFVAFALSCKLAKSGSNAFEDFRRTKWAEHSACDGRNQPTKERHMGAGRAREERKVDEKKVFSVYMSHCFGKRGPERNAVEAAPYRACRPNVRRVYSSVAAAAAAAATRCVCVSA